MIRTTLLLALAAALVPGAALAHAGRDDHPAGVQGVSPQVAHAPKAIYVLRGTVTGVSVPTGFTMDVKKANDAGATALGGASAHAGPVNPPVSFAVKVDLTTRIYRAERGKKNDHGANGGKSDLGSLQVGDEVTVIWATDAGLDAAGLAGKVARKVLAKAAPKPKPVTFMIRGVVVSPLPTIGTPPTTFLVHVFRANRNATKAINAVNPSFTGGSYDADGFTVIIDASTKVRFGGHWGHHKGGKGVLWRLSRVKVGDRITAEWKAPALSAFWTQPARKVEIKSSWKGHQ